MINSVEYRNLITAAADFWDSLSKNANESKPNETDPDSRSSVKGKYDIVKRF